jgi:hypothetical protein
MKTFFKILHEKYPPCPIRKHTISYCGVDDKLTLTVWVGIHPHYFTLTNEDLNDIPKLLDGLEYLLPKTVD